jgi:tRNA1(Val) A37 N6-methylase TrmN6
MQSLKSSHKFISS